MISALKRFAPCLLIYCLFFVIIINSLLHGLDSLTSLILIIFAYVPLLASLLLFKIINNIIALILLIVALLIVSVDMILPTITLFIIPAMLFYLVVHYLHKDSFHGNLITITIAYMNITVIVSMIYVIVNYDIVIYNSLMEYLQFFYIAIKHEALTQINANDHDVIIVLKIIATFLPSFIVMLWFLWLWLNFSLILGIKKTQLIDKKDLINLTLPKIFTIFFIIMIIVTLALQLMINYKFIASSMNILYILYNSIMIFFIPYCYIGVKYMWHRIKLLNNAVLNILFFIFMFFFLIEILIFAIIVGIVIESRYTIFGIKDKILNQY